MTAAPPVVLPAVPSGFAAREPVVTISTVTGIAVWVLGILVTHGIITGTVASALTQQVVPVVAGLIVAASGLVARRFVTPAAHVGHDVAGVEQRVGRLVGSVEAHLSPAALAAVEKAVTGAVRTAVANTAAGVAAKAAPKPPKAAPKS